MILHRLGRLLGAVLLLAPSLAFGQTALQQPATSGAPDTAPVAINKLYANDLFLQGLINANFARLGPAAFLTVGTVTGSVADGGALTAEVARAVAAEQANAAAIALRAPIDSPGFMGTPTVPTASPGTSTSQAASTAYVTAAIAATPQGQQATAVSYSAQTLTSSQQGQARTNIGAVASGDMLALGSGSTATTQAAGDNTTKVATDAFVTGAVSSYAGTVSATYAPVASPNFTGVPKAPTASAGDNSVALATTAYADRAAANARALSFRNRIRNGNFAINQRVVSGTVTLAAGAYGHDGWKAGAAGATYTFNTAASGDTAITITSGTLLQVIEGGLYLREGGSYAASWSGTATCRAYQGMATGSYVASPFSVASWTAGSNGTVECSTGTLGLVQFEPGTQATVFERRDDEMRRCMRYFQKTYDDNVAPGSSTYGGMVAITTGYLHTYASAINFPVTMAAAPTMSFWDGTGNANSVSSNTTGSSTGWGSQGTYIGAFVTSQKGAVVNWNAGSTVMFHYTASAEL